MLQQEWRSIVKVNKWKQTGPCQHYIAAYWPAKLNDYSPHKYLINYIIHEFNGDYTVRRPPLDIPDVLYRAATFEAAAVFYSLTEDIT